MALVGCRQEEGIKTYVVVTEGRTPPEAASEPPPAARSAPPMSASGDVPVGTGELQHTPPEGWTEQPGSSIRKASMATPGGATVTAFVFPASAPAMADPLANVNRWRGEVGLGPTTAAELAEVSQEIELAGATGTYVELVGETETTLAAMTPRGSQVWFFKLRGPKEEAAAQRATFRTWLDSIQL